MSARWSVLPSLALALALAACTGTRAPELPPAHRAFYYWRTTFTLSDAERATLTARHIDRLYVRAFDVGWSAAERAPELLGKLTVTDPVPAGVEVVPVVFLRTEVFARLGGDHAALAALAKSTWAEVARRVQPFGAAPRELQLDCDWTDSTRDAFFEYLRAVHAASGLPLSATIRLHQIKFRERTGVPPVERGMLMFYNMGGFSAVAGKRAIFDADSANQYVGRLADYPLPLDVALPIYSWTVQVRDERVVDLLQATDPDELPGLDFLSPAGDDRYTVTRSSFLHGTMLREGDMLKIERLGPADTLEAATLVATHLPPKARTLSLFDLSERNLKRYGTDDLEQIFGAIH
jgi:hypothetical protein